jgi:prolyl-tRNA editing enzyme YbaK/EbsC (Cys-tRNA(Pro) deacylase)
MAGRETPATAAARRAGIHYEVLEYEHDEAAFEHETIFVSAGRRGLELELAPADLAALTGAATARLTR